jgi:hypothetical protein
MSRASRAIKYNVSTIGPRAVEHGPTLKRRLRKRLRELSETLLQAVGFLDAASTLGRDAKTPLVAVYFGGAPATAKDLNAVQSLRGTASVIIPVVPDSLTFNAAVPPELHGINGVELSPNDPQLDVVANLVLENLGLLRQTRRLFLSYRRTDSSHEALQLRHELDSRGYDVFLDTHSVPKGDAFQEVLWHRLADSDVMVLLDTPGFVESRWTKEELAQAEAMTIGIVQVIWPKHQPSPYTDLCERIYLQDSDLRGNSNLGLTDDMLKAIASAVEQLRARSLAARHDNLVREFCDAAASINIAAVVQPDRYVSAALPSGQSIAAIPAVGVLDAQLYHQASRRFTGKTPTSEVFLIYDHRGLRPIWGDFLDWLDGFLPVKAVRITNVANRLKGL